MTKDANSICHGEKWRKKAEKVINITKISEHGGSYAGVGGAKCTGTYRIPFCITMFPSQLTLKGSFKSNELMGANTPMLLSLPAQSKLGLVKDVRRGTCLLAD